MSWIRIRYYLIIRENWLRDIIDLRFRERRWIVYLKYIISREIFKINIKIKR